jgi:flagellin-specific chaperone FliS
MHAVHIQENETVVPAPPTASPRQQERLAIYKKEHYLNLQPVQVIEKLYDTAILGCKKNDSHLAQRAITELTVALNFDHKEVSVGLFQLYQYCKTSIREGRHEEALSVLEELRAIWKEAFHL